MTGALLSTLLPENQRRTLDELTADLDMNHGDIHAKRTAFWTMLTLSAVIASAGVLADSTATVIGAMIIAPLSTPIMGVALALVKREPNGGFRFVLLGGSAVVLVGVLFALVLPGTYDSTSLCRRRRTSHPWTRDGEPQRLGARRLPGGRPVLAGRTAREPHGRGLTPPETRNGYAGLRAAFSLSSRVNPS